MSTLITVLHVITCLFLMLTVLLQSGKGGGMGAAFGGGGNAATVFGGSGASGFLKRLTAIAGTVFMITSMVLAFIASRNSGDAFETFGEKQKEIAAQKKKAKAAADSALKSMGSGSAGSGAVGSGSAGTGSAMIPFGSGASPGSATPVETGSATIKIPGAETPAETPAVETPIDPPAGSAAKPAAGSAAKPAAKPATGSGAKPAAAKPAKPAAEAPARAPTGESPPTTGSNAPVSQ